MTVRLAFANQKGGVGKSTLTLQTAYYASQQGLKVLVIDMDGQGNTSTKIVGREAITNIPSNITRSVDLFNSELEQVFVMQGNYGIDLLPAMINDDQLYAQEAASIDTIINPSINLETIAENYDLIIIDCPPSLGRLLSAGLIMADKIIMPIQVSGFAVDGVGGLFRVVEQLQQIGREDLEISGIVINSFNSRSKQHHQAVKELREKVGDLVIDTVISTRSPIDQATNESKPIWEIKTGAARAARAELTGAIEEIFKRIGVTYE